jgi:hypothetical protein
LVFRWSRWVLVYSFCSFWVFCLSSFVFSLISISSYCPEILSSICSSVLEWLFSVFFIWFKGFLFLGFLPDSFFWGFPYLCEIPLSCLVLSSLFHLSLFFNRLLCFILEFSKFFLNSFSCFCVFSSLLFGQSSYKKTVPS